MNGSSAYQRFILLCLASLALSWRILFATFALAFRNDAYTHILLILPISAALIFLEWTPRTVEPEPNSRAGSVLLVLAALIGFIGGGWRRGTTLTADMQLSIGMLALVTWWIGAFVCCFGIRASRKCLFSLCFLLWLVPLPEFALNHIVSFLQQGSAYAARLLFGIARVPVAQDGVRLSIPGLTLEVAKECSSIRSSLMLLVTTMVLAHLLLHSGWGKALVIVTAIPLSLAKNGLRVFTLAILGVYVDPAFLNGWLHHHGGVIFFLVFLASLFALLRLVRWAECKPMAQLTVTHLATPIAASKANT